MKTNRLGSPLTRMLLASVALSVLAGAAQAATAAPNVPDLDADLVEVSLTGSNRAAKRHPEAGEIRRGEIPRSLPLGVRWIR